jgi:hypothetical protein
MNREPATTRIAVEKSVRRRLGSVKCYHVDPTQTFKGAPRFPQPKREELGKSLLNGPLALLRLIQRVV